MSGEAWVVLRVGYDAYDDDVDVFVVAIVFDHDLAIALASECTEQWVAYQTAIVDERVRAVERINYQEPRRRTRMTLSRLPVSEIHRINDEVPKPIHDPDSGVLPSRPRWFVAGPAPVRGPL